MRTINTNSLDIIWNYIGTIVSMASGFVLLPLLMRFLTSEELGLWYVYVAVANLAMLFEFGFNPTFARNIVYVVSGARRLTPTGCDPASVREGVDWHLLNVVIRASKAVYALISVAALLLLATVGTWYVSLVTAGEDVSGGWLSWAIFCASVFLNLYFLYSVTILRGYGDVAGENRAKTFAKLIQILVSGVLLLAGAGLVGASVGYLASAVSMRLLALAEMRRHADIEAGRASDATAATPGEVREVLGTVGHVAWRDGVVQLACYASTQAMSIMSSLFLGLAETGTYSVLLQLATAVYNFASAYPKSFYPSMQAAFAEGDAARQRRIVSTGVVAYWGLFAFGAAGVIVVILPLLPIIKPGVAVDYGLFLGLAVYLGLWSQHSIFCNYIISMNEVPYMVGYLVAAVLGAGLAAALCGVLGMGAWGIVLSQALSQVVYNNWRWPSYLCRRLGTTYSAIVSQGARIWVGRIRRVLLSR